MITRRTAIVAASALTLGRPARADDKSTLLYGRGADSLSLDPAEAMSSEDFKITDYIFDGLVRFTGQGSEIGPALAESWERSAAG
jgi:peptide/nickel transport system substrate-binding protein